MKSTKSDEDLIEDILRGAGEAFSQLYDRYRHPIYSLAYRILHDAEEAHDATQEIFIKAYYSLKDIDPRKCKFNWWIFRLATNHAIDCWRLRRRRAETPLVLDSSGPPMRMPALENSIPSPYTNAENREKISKLLESIDLLPLLQKRVFILRYFKELKLEQIAAIENCTLGTVKKSLFRATRFVRHAVKRSVGKS